MHGNAIVTVCYKVDSNCDCSANSAQIAEGTVVACGHLIRDFWAATVSCGSVTGMSLRNAN